MLKSRQPMFPLMTVLRNWFLSVSFWSPRYLIGAGSGTLVT